VFIAGSLPAIGDWEPCTVGFEYLDKTPYGFLWRFQTEFQPMAFKLCYGREGDGWAAGEWWGLDNRTLPSPDAQVDRTKDGGYLLLCEFGKRPNG